MAPTKTIDERATASLLTLLIGKLTKWTGPVGGGGDPVYLTAEQTAEIATEGVRLLAQFLPPRASEQILEIVTPMPRPAPPAVEARLASIGSLGGIIHIGNPGDAPGCCVWTNGRLHCVK